MRCVCARVGVRAPTTTRTSVGRVASVGGGTMSAHKLTHPARHIDTAMVCCDALCVLLACLTILTQRMLPITRLLLSRLYGASRRCARRLATATRGQRSDKIISSCRRIGGQRVKAHRIFRRILRPTPTPRRALAAVIANFGREKSDYITTQDCSAPLFEAPRESETLALSACSCLLI